MNFGQWALLWCGIAVVILVPALVGGLIGPQPDTGLQVPLGFPSVPTQYIVAATCNSSGVPVTPQTNYDDQTNVYYTIANSTVDRRWMSQLVWAWAQLIQHDVFKFTTNNASLYNTSYGLFPQLIASTSNCSSLNGRTMVLDASSVYSDSVNPSRLSLLRTGTFGMLKTSTGGFLPFVTNSSVFLAGDEQVNDNPQLAALVNLFVREHNFWCGQLRNIHPSWTDDQLFWKARSYVIVEIQRITMEEWLPVLLGGYLGINPPIPTTLVFNTTLPYVSAEFATIGSEFFRSLTSGVNTSVTNVTSFLLSNGLEGVLQGAWQSPTLDFDVLVALDQAAPISIALTRAQELGITTNYSALCAKYKTTPQKLPQGSKASMTSVWNEAPLALPGGSLQFTTVAILLDQLQRSIAMDTNWYTLPTTRASVGSTFYPILTSTTLAEIFYRNTLIRPCNGCNVDTSVFWLRFQ